MRPVRFLIIAGALGLGAPAAWGQGSCGQSRCAAGPDRDVYVSQIGNGNAASVTQTARVAVAEVRQQGDDNQATIRQNGPALAYADIAQMGDANYAVVAQSGSSGSNRGSIEQRGSGNDARLQQSADGTIANVAALYQQGDGNSIALAQDGEDNQAAFSQIGDGNLMGAQQLGSGNRLDWTQQGNNLSALGIVQTGGQTIQVLQTK